MQQLDQGFCVLDIGVVVTAVVLFVSEASCSSDFPGSSLLSKNFSEEQLNLARVTQSMSSRHIGVLVVV